MESQNPDNFVHEVPLEQIRPAPWNPPSRMIPEKVKELADSIQIEGQQSPALLRPIEADSPVRYELVWGHRRYAALQLLSGRSFTFKPARDGQATIKAFVREMTEEAAMISSGIENLQREGFSDIEEAEFFQTCSERYGESAVKILAEKLSVSQRYIRKRLTILKLPEAALKLWRSGAWHVGHMEQLLRIGDPDKVAKFIAQGSTNIPVWELKDRIDRLAVPLHSGNFDKGECKTCLKNSDAQKKLFGGDADKGKCLDQKCFCNKQQAWLDLNWIGSKNNKWGTQAAIIGDYNTKTTGIFNSWGTKPGEKCKSCPHFTTIHTISGQQFHAYHEMACLGKSSCLAAVSKEKQKDKKSRKNKKDLEAPRVDWHGEYFRQQFYQEEIPRLLEALPADDPRRLQLALATIIFSCDELHQWFCSKYGVELPKREWEEQGSTSFPVLLKLASQVGPNEAQFLSAEALIKIALHTGYGHGNWNPRFMFIDSDRQALAEFLNLDWSRYQVTEEYLQKKTKAEIVRFIVHDSGLMAEPEFQKFCAQHHCPTPEKLAQAKKPVLVELLLQSPVSLLGRLPKEIADRSTLQVS